MALLPLSLVVLAAPQDLQTLTAPQDPSANASEHVFEASSSEDDSVPLPIDPQFASGADGDTLLAPASGDPFFLGFAAGAFRPAATERVDPDLLAQLRTWTDGRPAQESYAFVMFSKRITQPRLDQLAALGVRVLGFHPHYCMKVALAPAAVDLVASLDFVRWVGTPKNWQKVHPALLEAFESTPAGEPVEAWIDVYDSDLCADSLTQSVGSTSFGDTHGEVAALDSAQLPRAWQSNGWQQRALQELGLDVYEYVDTLRAFRVRMLPAALEMVTALDFVQFVEPQGQATLAHDESMPMILADRTRASWNGGTNSAVVGAQVDSGIEYSHLGITGYYWWQNNYTGEPGTDDLCGHGTHVAGTFHGSGNVEDSYEGVANGLGWGSTGRFFNVKHFSGSSCSSSGTSLATIMSGLHSAVTDGNGDITPRPHVINHSWGTTAPSGGYFGTEADAREVDAEVYTYDQLHVWAAGNEGSTASTIRLQASAKNALTVGGVRDYATGGDDPGELYSSSSRGPCADGRWKPNLCAPATAILSADASTTNQYVEKTGTSMAAPHVTGLAAQLCDHYPFLRYNPPTLGAVLMATAMTRNNILLGGIIVGGSTHPNTYGTGRIEAVKAHNLNADGALFFWGWTQGTSGLNYVDIPINANATRITVCMFYTEPAASSGASQALVNDLDLYLDAPPLTVGATGDYTAQQNSINNVEIRSLNNPIAGTWRLKVDSAAATTNSQVGVCAYVSYGPVAPDGTLSVTANDTFVKPGDDVTLTATATNPSYIASAVYFDSTSSGDSLQSATMLHEDGATANLMNNHQAGRDILVGDIRDGDSRTVTWVTRWLTEGVKSWSVEARSENWVDETGAVNVTVDGTPPPVPSAIHSTTHTPGVWSSDPNIAFAWTQSPDALSGVDGYSWSLTTGGSFLPDAIKDIGAVTSFATTLPANGVYAFNLRPVDKCGNWQTLLTYAGFFKYDGTAPVGPSGLGSSSHTVGVPSCDTLVSLAWTAASDADSGLAGYLGAWNTSPSFDPTGSPTINAGWTSMQQNIGSSLSPRYFHLRAVDNAGNYGTTQHFGPLLVNSNPAASYCTGKVNSLGCTPTVGWFGLPSKSIGSFTVTCSNVINQKNGLLFWGTTPSATPFQGGLKCVASPTFRTQNASSGGSSSGSDCSGSYAFQFSTTYMNQFGIDPGDSLYAQFWMRDPASPSTTGLSNAVSFTVCQ